MNAFNPEHTKLVTITDVGSRELSGKNGSFTMYDIKGDDGQVYNTTKRDFAESAYSLLNQQAQLVYYDRVNGTWTNHNLTQPPMPPLPNPAQAAQMAAQAQQVLGTNAPLLRDGTLPFQTNTPPQTPIPPPPTVPPSSEKDRQIHRQTAAKVAASLAALGNPDPLLFWENCVALARFFDDGTTPLPSGGGGGDSYDDGIPFLPTL